MTNSKYVPKRRFKEFELDDEWEQLKLGEHANILTGGTPNTSISSYWEPKEIPWMSSGEVNRRRLDKTDNMISNDGIRNSSARWVKKHSILIALAGQGKTRGMVAVNNIPLTTNQSIAAIEPDKTLNYEFVFQNLSKRYDELRLISSGDGSRGGLNKQIVSDISIACPNVNEQELIGNFLADFDSLITMNQHKLDKLKNLKKAYLSEMFPAEGERVPKRRFPGFEGEWEWKKLGELATIVRGASPRPIQDPKWFDSESEVGWLRISDVTEQNGRIYKLSQRLSSLGQEKTRVVSEPHLILSIAATVGKPVINYVRTGIHDGFLIFQEPKFEIEYMYYLLGMFRKNWTAYGQPGSQLNLNSDIVKEQRVAIPSQSEQVEISKFFKKLDQSITLQQQKLDKLNDLKKAYLNELFV